MLAFGLCILATVPLPAAARAEGFPSDICVQPPELLAHSARSYLDDTHRSFVASIVNAVNDYSEGWEARGEKVKKGLTARIGKERRAGRKGGRYITFLADFTHFNDEQQNASTRERTRQSVLKGMSAGIPSPAAADSMAAFVTGVLPGMEFGPDPNDELTQVAKERATLAAIRQALAAHRGFFGEHPRQLPLWLMLLEAAPVAEQVGIAADFAAASLKTDSQRMQLFAHMAWLRRLNATDPQFARTASIAVPLLRLAASARQEDGTTGCLTAFGLPLSQMMAAVEAIEGPSGVESFTELAAKQIAESVSLGTHEVFVLEDISELLSLRVLRGKAYRTAMANLDREYIMSVACPDDDDQPEACAMLVVAEILDSLNLPELALAVSSDADVITGEGATSSRLRWKVAVRRANLEWKYGQRSLVRDILDRAKGRAPVAEAEPLDRLAYFHLLFLLADMELDDMATLSSMRLLIDESIAILDAPFTSENEDRNDLRTGVSALTDELVRRVVVGRLCSGCRDDVAVLARRWIEYRMENAADAQNYSRLYLLRLRLGGLAPEERRRLDSSLEHHTGPLWKRLFSSMRKGFSVQGIDEENKAREFLTILLAYFTVGWDENEVTQRSNWLALLAQFRNFVSASSLEEKAVLWTSLVEHANLFSYSEDGNTARFRAALDALADDLSARGFPSGALGVLDNLASQLPLEPRDSDWPEGAFPDQSPDANVIASNFAVAKRDVVFWTSVHARLAAAAALAKDEVLARVQRQL